MVDPEQTGLSIKYGPGPAVSLKHPTAAVFSADGAPPADTS